MIEFGENILVVDRHKPWMDAIREWARGHNVAMHHCVEAERGIEEAGQESYDCVVVNVSVTGLGIFERMQTRCQPWVALSDEPWLEASSLAVESSARAYLYEPVSPDILIHRIAAALRRKSVHQAIQSSAARSADTQRHMRGLLDAVRDCPKPQPDMCSRDFVDATVRNLVEAAADLHRVCRHTFDSEAAQPVCHLFNCPRLQTLEGAVRQTIDVLEGTRSAFRSRQLADLRKTLESIIGSMA